MQEKINVLRLGLRRCMAGLAALAVVVVVQGAWGVESQAEPNGRAARPYSGQESWIEPIEVYTLPWDPEWYATALHAASSGSLDWFGRSADEIAEARRRLPSDAGSSSKERKALAARQQKLFDRLRASAGREMPLTVVRAWSGAGRTELLLTFGRGQRAVADRIDSTKPVLAALGLARPGDDQQAIRTTVAAVLPSSVVPSDLVRLADAPVDLSSRAFGEVDSSALSVPFVIACSKDPTPGSGKLELSIDQPPREMGILTGYPWYAEFRLYELAKDGTRAREVKFEGSNAAVAAAPIHMTPRDHGPMDGAVPDRLRLRAIGRVEVKSPQPWGYEAEIVKWYGVAPKDRLVPHSQSSRSPSGNSRRDRTAGPDGSSAPSQPAPPLEESLPAELPEEPTTPDVPAARP